MTRRELCKSLVITPALAAVGPCAFAADDVIAFEVTVINNDPKHGYIVYTDQASTAYGVSVGPKSQTPGTILIPYIDSLSGPGPFNLIVIDSKNANIASIKKFFEADILTSEHVTDINKCFFEITIKGEDSATPPVPIVNVVTSHHK